METGPGPKEIEKEQINFNNPELRVVLDISPEADNHLPVISPEDLKTKRERFRLFYGKTESVSHDKIKVKIEAVTELPDQPDFYEEGNAGVRIKNIQRAKLVLDKAMEQEGLDWQFIGEIHTHPITQSELEENQRPWHPSPEDEQGWKSFYESGFLKSGQPCIFGIAGSYEGKTGYAFYRVIKHENDWGIQRIE